MRGIPAHARTRMPFRGPDLVHHGTVSFQGTSGRDSECPSTSAKPRRSISSLILGDADAMATPSGMVSPMLAHRPDASGRFAPAGSAVKPKSSGVIVD